MSGTFAVTTPSITDLEILERLKQQATERFNQVHPEWQAWLEEHHLDLEDFKQSIYQFLAAVTVAGAVFIRPTVDAKVVQQLASQQNQQQEQLLASISQEEHQAVMEKLQTYVRQPAGHLPTQEELYVEQQLSDMLGFTVTAELEGHRLNHSIGIMGGEQHLKRFPTDTLDQHDAYLESGIAPNRGAFGWFTEDGQLTPEAVQREKYYFAVQTLYLPDWNSNHAQLKPWYKFRKMIVINPAEEVAVVGVVGDAGPALWVKKQYGGSPEIIREGKIWSPKSRGHVLLFFVDDPNNTIPLGPIDLSTAKSLAQTP